MNQTPRLMRSRTVTGMASGPTSRTTSSPVPSSCMPSRNSPVM